MDSCSAVIGDFENCLRSDVKNLEKFLSLDSSDVDAFCQSRACVDGVRFCFGQDAIDGLLTDGFSNEQIWQQLKYISNSGRILFDDAVRELNKKRKRIHSVVSSVEKQSKDADVDETAWDHLGKTTIDELMARGLSEDDIWKQLLSASKRGDKTFQAAFAYLQKKRADNGTEHTEKRHDPDENDDADSDDDDYLKKICSNWGIGLKKSKLGDYDSVEDDELNEDVDEEENEDENDDDSVKDSDEGEDKMSTSDNEHGLEMLKKSLQKSNKQPERTSIVDDKFFRLNEMSSFLDQMDKLENQQNSNNDDDDDVDFGASSGDDDEDDEKNAKYSDFFDDPETNSINEDDDDSDNDRDGSDDDNEKSHDDDDDVNDDDDHSSGDEDEDDTNEADLSTEENDNKGKNNVGQNTNDKIDSKEPKSAFQIRQDLLRKQITGVEDSNLEKRPWYLMGDVTGSERPEDSLLTRHLDFKFNDALTVVEDDDDENALAAEEILRKHYESEAFVVNVTRKVKPTDTSFKYRKEIVLNEEKSKLGLAEIYEKEYLAMSEKQKEEEDEEYKENRNILDNLLRGLRMMFSDGPVSVLPPKMELKVLENVPSVTVEEVAPFGVSDASRLTAEEIQGRRKQELVGETERTKTDKNRARRKKKLFQHHMAVKKMAKAADPNSKEAHEQAQKQLEKKSKLGKHVTIHQTEKKKKKMSSKDFFEKLQNQVSSKISKEKNTLNKKKAKKNN